MESSCRSKGHESCAALPSTQGEVRHCDPCVPTRVVTVNKVEALAVDSTLRMRKFPAPRSPPSATYTVHLPVNAL